MEFEAAHSRVLRAWNFGQEFLQLVQSFSLGHACARRAEIYWDRPDFNPGAECPAGIGNTQIWGTQPDSIDEAEDRDRWMACLQRLDIKQPPGGMVVTEEGALAEAGKLGYPVRPLQLSA